MTNLTQSLPLTEEGCSDIAALPLTFDYPFQPLMKRGHLP